MIEAALVLMSGQGYSATSMEEIAKASGLSKEVLAQIFQSKESLFKAMLDCYFEEKNIYCAYLKQIPLENIAPDIIDSVLLKMSLKKNKRVLKEEYQ